MVCLRETQKDRSGCINKPNDPARLPIQQIPLMKVNGKLIPTPTDLQQKNQQEITKPLKIVDAPVIACAIQNVFTNT